MIRTVFGCINSGEVDGHFGPAFNPLDVAAHSRNRVVSLTICTRLLSGLSFSRPGSTKSVGMNQAQNELVGSCVVQADAPNKAMSATNNFIERASTSADVLSRKWPELSQSIFRLGALRERRAPDPI